MRSDDIQDLLLYGTTLWGHMFPAPTSEHQLAVTELVWNDVLGDLDPNDIRGAMASWTEHWPPTPNQLRQATQLLVRRMSGENTAPDADQAFAEVLRAVSAHGYTSMPEWSHPAIGATVEALGGWVNGICFSENEPALRAHFLKLYESASARINRQDDTPVPVIARRMEQLEEIEGIKRIDVHALGLGAPT